MKNWGLGDGSRVGLSRGRVGTACQPSLPGGDGLACLEVGARFHLVLPNKEGAAKPRPYPIKEIAVGGWRIGNGSASGRVGTACQASCLLWRDAVQTLPCLVVGLALRANLGCLFFQFEVARSARSADPTSQMGLTLPEAACRLLGRVSLPLAAAASGEGQG